MSRCNAIFHAYMFRPHRADPDMFLPKVITERVEWQCDDGDGHEGMHSCELPVQAGANAGKMFAWLEEGYFSRGRR
jgi:hypothetical protein